MRPSMRPDAPSLSVVLPTHQRAGILRKCLEHLAAQTIREEMEVIVVSDGHDPETAALFSEGSWQSGVGSGELRVRFVEIPKSHQGTARNRGVEMAQAPIVLFAQDDIFLERSCCEEHQLAHAALEFSGEPETLVLGQTRWDPELAQTDVMRWLDETGWQFGYKALAPFAEDFVPRADQHRYTYTSHVSLRAETARRFPFREDARLYGWEDMEWGIRLRDAGVRLFYIPAARAAHHHPMTLEDSLARMETLGRSAVAMRNACPQFDRLPAGWKLLAYRALGFLPTMRGRHAYAFAKGIREGMGETGAGN